MDDYITSPLTGRKIRVGSKKYKALMADKVMGLNPADRQNNILAVGSDAELRTIRSRFNPTVLNPNLRIHRDKEILKTRRRRLTKDEATEAIKKETMNTFIQNKPVLDALGLTNDQTFKIINKIIDCKMIKKDLDIASELDEILGLSKPKLGRQTNSLSVPSGTVKNPPRFMVMDLPSESDTDTTAYGTAYDSTSGYDIDSDSSETS